MFNIRRLLELRRVPIGESTYFGEIVISVLCIAIGLISGLGAVLFNVVLTGTGTILQALSSAHLLPLIGRGAFILVPIMGTLIAAVPDLALCPLRSKSGCLSGDRGRRAAGWAATRQTAASEGAGRRNFYRLRRLSRFLDPERSAWCCYRFPAWAAVAPF